MTTRLHDDLQLAGLPLSQPVYNRPSRDILSENAVDNPLNRKTCWSMSYNEKRNYRHGYYLFGKVFALIPLSFIFSDTKSLFWRIAIDW